MSFLRSARGGMAERSLAPSPDLAVEALLLSAMERRVLRLPWWLWLPLCLPLYWMLLLPNDDAADVTTARRCRPEKPATKGRLSRQLSKAMVLILQLLSCL